METGEKMMENVKRPASPRDVFLHLFAIVTLYISAFSFGRLIFDYINLFLPDALEMGQYHAPARYSYQSMRWSIAALIIVFPAYFFVSRYLLKLYEKNPAQKNLRIRKWLIYFTLFLAAIVIIIDLVTLVFRLLSGELTVRFILKVLTVLYIAGVIFGYYMWELRRHKYE
ncbi:MAG: DUF5671 domain-containing protein [Patescibacteria group bacterium]